jgi:3-deoxy-D-manno-octulosonic-acid transferase
MLWFFYNILFAIGFMLMIPRFLVRMRRRGGYAPHFAERFGVYEPAIRSRLEQGGWVWVHAVSVGEIFMALRFMDELRARRPGIRFILSMTTSTGHTIAMDKVKEPDLVIYFPVDFPVIVRRVLDLLRPAALVLVECELWPNLIRLARRRGIPVVLINGRISEHSYRGYRKLRLFTRPLLEQVSLFCVQSEHEKSRLVDLGADPSRLHVLGSAKYDMTPADGGGEKMARAVCEAAGFPPDRLVLLGGSTWEGEEAALLDVYGDLRARFANLVLVLVPRHAERSPEVLAAIEERGLAAVRRSTLKDGANRPVKRPDVLLVDTTGELRAFYACADVIFVGKSLTQRGGQNIIEPAQCGRPIIVGPHMENFPVIMEDFLAFDALVQVQDEAGLRLAVEGLLSDAARRAMYGERAARLAREKAGALGRTVGLIEPLIR